VDLDPNTSFENQHALRNGGLEVSEIGEKAEPKGQRPVVRRRGRGIGAASGQKQQSSGGGDERVVADFTAVPHCHQ